MKKIELLWKAIVVALFTVAFTVCLSCSDFLHVDSPENSLGYNDVFATAGTVEAALRGIYSDIQRTGFTSGSSSSATQVFGVMADEFQSSLSTHLDFFTNEVDPANTTVYNQFWAAPFRQIYFINVFLEGLEQAADLSTSVTAQMKGEALFLRAFLNFYLVQAFGDIPLVTTTNHQINSTISCSSSEQVMALVKSDLETAIGLLGEDYSRFGNERVRANKWVALALSARVHLYIGEFQQAANDASLVIDQTGLFELENVAMTFLKSSQESIWQLRPAENSNTNEALAFIPASPQYVPSINISTELLNSFKSEDTRRLWIGENIVDGISYYYPLKYQQRGTSNPTQEYYTVLRLAELFLIRAEAEAHLGKFAESVHDLNTIRLRANLEEYNTTPLTQSMLLSEILSERRRELFAEWGHRWFDLHRYGIADSVIASQKPEWNTGRRWLPLPATEINQNPNLLKTK